MNRREHLLTIAVEECGEVAQRVTKLMRFGDDEVQPNATQNPENLNNADRVLREFYDLVAALEMAGLLVVARSEEGDYSFIAVATALVEAKKAKVEKYLEYSKAQGTLSDV